MNSFNDLLFPKNWSSNLKDDQQFNVIYSNNYNIKISETDDWNSYTFSNLPLKTVETLLFNLDVTVPVGKYDVSGWKPYEKKNKRINKSRRNYEVMIESITFKNKPLIKFVSNAIFQVNYFKVSLLFTSSFLV